MLNGTVSASVSSWWDTIQDSTVFKGVVPYYGLPLHERASASYLLNWGILINVALMVLFVKEKSLVRHFPKFFLVCLRYVYFGTYTVSLACALCTQLIKLQMVQNLV